MKKKQSLLEQAKAINPGSPGVECATPMEDRIELALAWVKGEVSQMAAGKVIGTSGSSVYQHFAIGLREAYRRGLLVEKK